MLLALNSKITYFFDILTQASDDFSREEPVELCKSPIVLGCTGCTGNGKRENVAEYIVLQQLGVHGELEECLSMHLPEPVSGLEILQAC